MFGIYSIELKHEGLHKYRVITGDDRYVVQQKARAQQAQWDEQWAKRVKALEKEQARAAEAAERAENKAVAEEETRKAQAVLEEVDGTLAYTLQVDDRIDWDQLKDRSEFPEPVPAPPEPVPRPKEPLPTDFPPRLGLVDRLSRRKKELRRAEAQSRYAQAHDSWQSAVAEAEASDLRQKATHEESLAAWGGRKSAFLAEQAAKNLSVDERRRLYESKDPGAVMDYCDLVLSSSRYPDFFPQDYELEYNADNGILIADYSLPAPDQLPRLKEVRFVQTRNELAQILVTEAEANKRYDSLLYQVCLRTIHELFEADTADAVRAVVFNGWVRSVDPATGKEVNACILSVQAQKESFMAIDLARVDPKACFKSLKGVGSAKLHSLAAVPPVLVMNREDHRFVPGREVVKSLDDSVNLAAMDWEEFEHLVREVFEAEFASGGGEVKVTQASRDGGVDAVAFDPDPIRGGKIVIQAKRYTNVVGVSAVRDLFGTVMNEGATKGILVTTSDYGPDAYEFAKGKPLTLLSGANLLSLLEKHGHRARLDLSEARAKW